MDRTMDSIGENWQALRSGLARRARDLHEAVRDYPQPIARCDEQLPRAIEQRDAAMRLARAADALDSERISGGQHDAWIARMRRFAADLAVDDPELMQLARRAAAEAG